MVVEESGVEDEYSSLSISKCLDRQIIVCDGTIVLRPFVILSAWRGKRKSTISLTGRIQQYAVYTYPTVHKSCITFIIFVTMKTLEANRSRKILI